MGSEDDRVYVQALMAYCAERSGSLKIALAAVNQDSVQTTWRLVRQFYSPPGVLFDQWGPEEQTVDLDDLDLLPPFRNEDGAWGASATTPSWSPTKCGFLAHFLIEAWHIQRRLRTSMQRLPVRESAVALLAHQRAREEVKSIGV
jgi:hypothetical protein